MKLGPRQRQVLLRQGFVAVYAIGPPHVVRIQDDEQHARMWEWMAAGIGHNGPPPEREIITRYWPVRWGITSDASDSVVTQANSWSPAWRNELLARVWMINRDAAVATVEEIKRATESIRLSWSDHGTPTTREWLELEVKGRAYDAGVTGGMDDYELLCALDDAVFRKYQRDTTDAARA